MLNEHEYWKHVCSTEITIFIFILLQDFPSIAQLKSLIATSGVSVIFGIANAKTSDYWPSVYKVYKDACCILV